MMGQVSAPSSLWPSGSSGPDVPDYVRPEHPAGRSPVRPDRTNLTAIEGKRLLQPRSPLGRDEGADTCPLIPQPLLDLI